MSKTLSTLATQIVARRLGQADAGYLPLRRGDWVNPGAIRLAQTGALPLGAIYDAVASAAERERHSRAAVELDRAGLLRRHRPGHATLTARGLRVARGLAWPYTAQDFRQAVNRLAELTAGRDCLDDVPGYGNGFVPECLVAGTPWGPACDTGALWRLSGCLLPALRCELLVSASTSAGHVFYALRGPVDSSRLASLVDAELEQTFDEDLAELYESQRAATRRQILAADAQGELGFLPVHAARLSSHRDYHDLRRIDPLFPSDPATLAVASSHPTRVTNA